MSRVLLIDADGERRGTLSAGLQARGFRLVVQEPGQGVSEKALAGVDIVLLGLAPDTAALVGLFRHADPLVPVVVVATNPTGHATAADLGRAGAYDFIVVPDPSHLDLLAPRLEDASHRQAIRRREVPVAEQLLGASPQMAQVRRYVAKAAQCGANVLITGESGTGKELVARAVHSHGPRREAPFLAINCSAIPDPLLESELFGHERGAFTGAVGRTRGKFEQADGGTLFFDEIGEMPPALQSKLLRVLQPPPGTTETTREFTRVGAEESCRVDVRVVFATHRDLPAEVRAGRFREDLFQRINVLLVHLPPLRKRREDVALLAEHFLRRHAVLEGQPGLRFDPLVLDVLSAYDYPLNVRELESLVRSLVIMKEAGATVVLGDLPQHLFGQQAQEEPSDAARLLTLDEVERAHVLHVLERSGGNKSRAARILGISRPALDRKLDRSAREGGGPGLAAHAPRAPAT